MDAFVNRLLSASRKPLFEPYQKATESDLAEIERKVNTSLPKGQRDWFLLVGFGDLNNELSFRAEWFSVIDRGQLKGHVIFAQDQCGNFYAFCTLSGACPNFCV